MKSKRFTAWATGISRSALSISFRLLLFNVLLVFLPVAAVLYLDVYEEQLLVSQEKTMVQQGRILAAALGGESSISRKEVEGFITNLAGRTETRLRVLDDRGRLIGDSSSPLSEQSYGIDEDMANVGKVSPRSYDSLDTVAQEVLGENTLLYRLATYPIRVYRKLFDPPVPVGDPDDYDARYPFQGVEVQAALEGRYGAATRLSSGGQRSVTLYTAIPVYNGDEVIGAVLSSQSTYRILKDLYNIRLVILKIFLASLIAAVIISLFLSATISSRIKKLGREARSISTGKGRISGSFTTMKLGDEIGLLSRSLVDLTGRLDRHIRFIDSLSRDISHEFKNPLAVIRSAAQMVESAEGKDKERFLTMIEDNTRRMESLLNGVEEISRLDSRLEQEEREAVDVDKLINGLLEGFRLRYPSLQWNFQTSGEKATVTASPERLSQIFVNIYENAATFCDNDSAIGTALFADRDKIRLTISNRGPEIPEEDLDRIFDRFYTSRDKGKEKHHGLGLSIVRAIAENYGGSVSASNGEKGPVFTLTFPEAGAFC
ncbi:HAMP domain-containing sensor histidine kinase [Spirochaeta isovalerica]|uniref:histidine kinase n=1 Tax=Spirochaeta isovalerica TaxID=150 RepID=A0A841RGX8_9SPIO|nr:ATP-binding protein [Spirochaeta isovalerica]MBB6482270.1 two-component system sensor histidine kinase ChvG [Spirochaeta isovalerica]